MVRSSDHVVERLTTALPVFDEYGLLVSPLGTVREHSRARDPSPIPSGGG